MHQALFWALRMYTMNKPAYKKKQCLFAQGLYSSSCWDATALPVTKRFGLPGVLIRKLAPFLLAAFLHTPRVRLKVPT